MDRVDDTSPLTPSSARTRRRPAPAPADIQQVRSRNLAAILRTLYTDGPLSRPQLARRVGVSVPTAGALVAELLEAGTVTDLGVIAEARVGKPAAKVAVNATGNAALVLDLTPSHFIAAVVDLDGTIIDRAAYAERAGTGDEAIEQAISLAQTLRARATVQLIGVGAASPGFVDQAGMVHLASRLDWHEVPLAEILTARLGLPAIVANDLNVLAVGERRARRQNDRDAIVVAIDNGVGAAVLLDSRPLLGEQAAAGEIGHIVVEPDGPDCICGGRGCLDVMVSAPHLSRRVRADGRAVLEPAGRLLGDVLAPVLSMLDVTVVDVLGPADLVGGEFAEGVHAGIAARLRPAVADALEINVIADDPDFVLHGAAALVREALFGMR